jgi:hypothetical protein
MNGSTVTINRQHKVKAFQKNIQKPDDNHHYKTVNIYSLSALTWQLVCKRLDHHISNNMVNGYYETIFADMATEGCLSCSPVFFDADRWYEIDTIADLRAAALVCNLYHHPSELIPDHNKVNDLKGMGIPLSSKRLPAIARSKRGSRRYPNRKVPAPVMSASLSQGLQSI